jgi:CRISPR-associated protein Cas5h
MAKLVVFDVSSSFGYFRKAFTTTNALTHAVIPRSSVEGLVGAILGLSILEYPEILKESKIAIETLSDVRKINMKYMHTNPDWWQNISYYFQNKTSTKQIQFAVPASVELLVNPKYRIYIDNEQTNTQLTKMLQDKKTFYTPYLGTSSMFCAIKHVGEFEYKIVSKKETPVRSSIPFLDNMPQIKLEKNARFAIEEGLPIHVDNERIPHGTYKIVYSPQPKTITISDDLAELVMPDGKSYVKFIPNQVSS